MTLPIKPLSDQVNVREAMRMDIRTYQYPFTAKQYKQLATGNVFVATAMVQTHAVGFVVWDRGSKEDAANIYRLGVLPELILRTEGLSPPHYATYRRFLVGNYKKIMVRRKGLGRRLFEFAEADIRRHGLAESVQMTVSSAQVRGKGDVDDVSGFIEKLGLGNPKVAEGHFFEYGKQEDAYIFRKLV